MSSVRCLHYDFCPYLNILIDVMEYVDAAGSVVNSPNINKGITTLAINLNPNSYMENIKKGTLQTLKTLHTFSKEHYKHNNEDKKLLTVSCVKEKSTEKFLSVKEEKTFDKVSCIKERKN